MNKTNNNQNQPQQYKPQTWMQEKLLTEEGYMPYCGNPRCREMPRTQFNGEQFYCRCCRWESSYPKEFIEAYKKKWKDEQFKELLETELKQWDGDSCEAKYRTEMLKELIEKTNED